MDPLILYFLIVMIVMFCINVSIGAVLGEPIGGVIVASFVPILNIMLTAVFIAVLIEKRIDNRKKPKTVIKRKEHTNETYTELEFPDLPELPTKSLIVLGVIIMAIPKQYRKTAAIFSVSFLTGWIFNKGYNGLALFGGIIGAFMLGLYKDELVALAIQGLTVLGG